MQAQTRALRRTVLTVGALNLAYFGVEFSVALAIGSVALFADSIDFLEDASVNFLILIALGWTARADGASGATPAVTLTVRDAQGAPVSGAAVRAQAFSNVRAGQARDLTFREIEPGVYRAELGPARPGLWELRMSATRGQQQFESALRFELERSPVGP